MDNLLVPVCLGATHIAWGAVRLEPVWMQTGEAAGFAAALARKNHTTPAALDPSVLVRRLADRRQLITFFNDIKVDAPEPWIPAAQYLGTRGFFAGYDLRSAAPLTTALAAHWARTFTAMSSEGFDPTAAARQSADIEKQDSPPVTPAAFLDLLAQAGAPAATLSRIRTALPPEAPLTRAQACHALYLATAP